MSGEKTLYIFSYGLEPAQITLETLSAIKKCDMVFSHCLDGGESDFISRACKELRMLRQLSPRLISAAVKKAFRTREAVGFLTYGNPCFLNATTAQLSADMEGAGVRVRVIPAVSSFDAIVNLFDLNRFSVPGLRLVDVAAAKKDIQLTPDMDTLFFVVGDLNLKGNGCYRKKFLEKLRKVYPGAQPAAMINCACAGDGSGRTLRSSVAGLKKSIKKADSVTTLFIPAVKVKRGKAV